MSQRKNVTSINRCRSWSGITIFVATAISCTFGGTIWLLSARLSRLGQADNVSVIDYTGVTAISIRKHEEDAQNIVLALLEVSACY